MEGCVGGWAKANAAFVSNAFEMLVLCCGLGFVTAALVVVVLVSFVQSLFPTF